MIKIGLESDAPGRGVAGEDALALSSPPPPQSQGLAKEGTRGRFASCQDHELGMGWVSAYEVSALEQASRAIVFSTTYFLGKT